MRHIRRFRRPRPLRSKMMIPSSIAMILARPPIIHHPLWARDGCARIYHSHNGSTPLAPPFPTSVLRVFISGDGDPRCNVRGLFITLQMCCRKKTMSPVDRALGSVSEPAAQCVNISKRASEAGKLDSAARTLPNCALLLMSLPARRGQTFVLYMMFDIILSQPQEVRHSETTYLARCQADNGRLWR